MFERRKINGIVGVLGVVLALEPLCFGAAKNVHAVPPGAGRKVAYSMEGDPVGALVGEESLKIRPLVVDSMVKEWTTGGCARGHRP